MNEDQAVGLHELVAVDLDFVVDDPVVFDLVVEEQRIELFGVQVVVKDGMEPGFERLGRPFRNGVVEAFVRGSPLAALITIVSDRVL